MEWLIFQSIESEVETRNYFDSIKIAYLLNLKIASFGNDDLCYFFSELTENSSIKTKLNYLISSSDNFPEEKEMFLWIQESFKQYAKIKHKSSKEITHYKGQKKLIEDCFKNYQKEYSEILDKKFQLSKLKDLLDEKFFYFYHNPDGTTSNSTYNEKVQLDLLQLKLNEPEEELSLFFLSNYKEEDVVMEIDFLTPMDKEAENQNLFYGTKSYTFPILDSLSTTELISTRKDLEKSTHDFRKKIKEWATICYANPNTTKGLEYFRKEMQPLLESTQNDILEVKRLQQISLNTQKKLESQIIIGEAPIEKIWELYFSSKTITQEVYDNLIKIKLEEFPKYEGRWPVIFYMLTKNTVNYINSETENGGLRSVRKSISLD